MGVWIIDGGPRLRVTAFKNNAKQPRRGLNVKRRSEGSEIIAPGCRLIVRQKYLNILF